MDTEKTNLIQTEIQRLRNQLAADTSDIGDYKIAKIYEARINGDPDPYVAADVITSRQMARKKLESLEIQLAQMNGMTTTTTETTAEKLNALDTSYDRSKSQLINAFVAALMADDTDLQTELKSELKELDAQYDSDRAAIEGGNA
ncbi:hypothetical protein [Mitsuokella jalaludinii]|uniref:hypothetical protein n=1 Tax=Mitsuokella jalaludinii TaxID=187979 RepID=UPI00307FABFE